MTMLIGTLPTGMVAIQPRSPRTTNHHELHSTPRTGPMSRTRMRDDRHTTVLRHRCDTPPPSDRASPNRCPAPGAAPDTTSRCPADVGSGPLHRSPAGRPLDAPPRPMPRRLMPQPPARPVPPAPRVPQPRLTPSPIVRDETHPPPGRVTSRTSRDGPRPGRGPGESRHGRFERDPDRAGARANSVTDDSRGALAAWLGPGGAGGPPGGSGRGRLPLSAEID
jgi:hypothetical protein